MDLAHFIGLPYRDHGRDRHGVDCYGLVLLFYREILGLEIPALDAAYASAEDGASVAECVGWAQRQWQAVETPQVGDVLLFHVLGWPAHVGVYLGNGDFLHAFRETHSCIERLNSITWKRRHIGTYRWHTT